MANYGAHLRAAIAVAGIVAVGLLLFGDAIGGLAGVGDIAFTDRLVVIGVLFVTVPLYAGLPDADLHNSTVRKEGGLAVTVFALLGAVYVGLQDVGGISAFIGGLIADVIGGVVAGIPSPTLGTPVLVAAALVLTLAAGATFDRVTTHRGWLHSWPGLAVMASGGAAVVFASIDVVGPLSSVVTSPTVVAASVAVGLFLVLASHRALDS